MYLIRITIKMIIVVTGCKNVAEPIGATTRYPTLAAAFHEFDGLVTPIWEANYGTFVANTHFQE